VHVICSRSGILLRRLILGRGWWRWALVSPDGVAPSRRVGVSASVNLPLHNKVQKFSSGTGSPGWSRKMGRKTVVVWSWLMLQHQQTWRRLVFGRPFVKRFALCYRTVVCTVLSVCKVGVLWPNL